MEQVVQPAGGRSFQGTLWNTLRSTWLTDQYRKYDKFKRQVMWRSEGERILLQKYHRIHGKPLNLANPETFTEKLFWRMIMWNRGHMPARFARLTDKYAVRSYVASAVGEKHLIKLLWHGDDPRTIPFDQLPREYVIKSNHACGQVIIVKGLADREAIVRQVSNWLTRDYYWADREAQYYRIPPRILIEECLFNEDGSLPFDYKIYCYNGRPEHILVRNHTHDICPFFDANWNLLDFSDEVGAVRPWVPRPENLDEMLMLAGKLSEGFGFVRVDLYNIRGHVYFGELTFTPAGGAIKYDPECWDLKHGEKWDLVLDIKAEI